MVKKHLQFIPVQRIDQVLAAALTRLPGPTVKETPVLEKPSRSGAALVQ